MHSRLLRHRSYVLSSGIVHNEEIMRIHPLAAFFLCAALTRTRTGPHKMTTIVASRTRLTR